MIKKYRHRLVRLASALLSAALLAALFPMGAFAADFELYNAPNGGILRVNRFTGIMESGSSDLAGDLVIPDAIEGVKVLAIADGAFRDCEELTSVTVPGSVLTIGDEAFFSCDKLTSITVSGSVRTIGNQAFSSCIALKSATLGEGVTSMGKDAFRYCYSLTSVSLPSTLAAVDNYAFASCLALKNITIPNGVDRIGDYAFSGCTSLTSVSLPTSVVSIGDYCFNGCTSLTGINLPAGLQNVPLAMFDGCTSLKELSVPEGAQRIYGLAFRNCKNLEKLSLPDSLSSIAASAFDGCSNVTFYVNAGSYAQAFAAANKIPFELGTFDDNNNDNPDNYPATPFTDDKSHWAKKYIEWAYAKGYIAGTSATTVSPDKPISRGQVVTILYRMEGRPAVGDPSFTDLTSSTSKYYKDGIAWAESTKVVSGLGGGRFGPDQNVTREQLARMLYNYAKYKGKNVSASGDMTRFRDVSSISSWAGAAMNWAVGVGILSGKDNAMLDPKGQATRAEASVMLRKFVDLK